MTKLEKLLEDIDPDRNLDQVAGRVDRAFNTFHMDSGVLHRWQDFEACMARFFRHIENAVLRLNPPLPVDLEFDWGRCAVLLRKEYGGRGEKAAFEMARTGSEGGLYSVLRAVARQMGEDYAGNEIGARISPFLKELSPDETFAAAQEYIKKYG
ncbi:MAG: hypothetical protein V2A74_10120, partial [bacterium]